MSDGPLDRLRRQLGGTVPGGLCELEHEQLEHLSAALHEARRRQSEALAAAGDRALHHVPRMLRGPIRRIVR